MGYASSAHITSIKNNRRLQRTHDSNFRTRRDELAIPSRKGRELKGSAVFDMKQRMQRNRTEAHVRKVLIVSCLFLVLLLLLLT